MEGFLKVLDPDMQKIDAAAQIVRLRKLAVVDLCQVHMLVLASNEHRIETYFCKI